MLRVSFTLIAKKQLTHDVYELVYSCPELSKEPPEPGQYVMFQLAPGLNRAYSLARYSLNESTFTLIIKRIADGRGSPMICDAGVGSILQGMIPLGHFTLQDTPRSKCFIGTGTGFAPLYCQIFSSHSLIIPPKKCGFIFGVRNFSDRFYSEEIIELGSQFQNFEYIQYFSREGSFESRITNHESRTGYVTDWITRENISHYEEFYICGSPGMVRDARSKLELLGIEKESIYWEQF